MNKPLTNCRPVDFLFPMPEYRRRGGNRATQQVQSSSCWAIGEYSCVQLYSGILKCPRLRGHSPLVSQIMMNKIL
jgi:hypothetical protein